MATNYIAPIWRMPRNANQSKFSNYSINFDGSSDFIDLGTSFNSMLELGDSFSISAWVNFNNTASDRVIISNISNSIAGFHLRVKPDESIRFILLETNSIYLFVDSSSLSIDTWHHVVCTYDGSGTIGGLNLYINSSLDNNNTVAQGAISTITSTDSLRIAKDFSNTPKYFNGQIDQVSIFDYKLSQDQVTYLYNLNNPMAITGAKPVAYYPLGDNSNPTALAGYPNASVGGSVFDFNSSFIDPGSVDLGVNGSVAMWFNPEVGSVTDYVLLGEGSQGFDYVIRRQSGAFYIWIGGTFYNFAIGNNIVDGSWNFLVITKSAGDVNVYLKNTSGEVSGSHTNAGWTSASFKFDRIGGRTINPINLPFNGEISNFQAWNTTLINTEVTTLYNYGSPIQTLANIPQNSNLKAWYKLDASEVYNSSTTEWSIDNNQNPSAYASSLNFNNDYINVNSFVFGGLTSLSISCWYNLNTISTDQTILAKWSTGTSVIIIYHDAPNGWRFLISGVTNFQSTHIATINTWQHLAVTYESGVATKIYLNGVGQGNTGEAGAIPSSTAWDIGKDNGATRNLNGELSNLAIWDTALTDSQVQTIYNNGTPEASISHSPTSWYKLDNTTTGIQDSAGSYNGTNNGATEYDGFVNALAGESSGMTSANLIQSDLYRTTPYSNYSINFDRAGSDKMSTPAGSNGILSGATSCSVSVWFNLTTTTLGNPGLQPFVSSWVNPNYNYIYRWYDGDLQFYLRLDSSTYAASYTWTPTTGVWHHTIGTYDGSTMRLYLDGVEVATNGAATGTIPTITTSDNIGIYASVYFMDGPLSNIAYWKNTTLTQSEITEIYNAGVPTDLSTFSGTAPSVWYPMDGKKTYYRGDVIVARDAIGTRDMIGSNLIQENIIGNAPGSNANGTGVSLDITDLKGDMSNSTKNAKSINMADYGDPNGQGVTPANSGRTTSVPG